MVWSSRRALVVAASAAIAAGCDAAPDPVSPPIKSPTLAMHDIPSGTGCPVENAAKVYISVYPKTIAVGGENATPYASVAGPNNEELRSLDVKFSIADTTIAHVTGTDSNGRPIISGRRSGTTTITGTCGSLSDSKELAVTGGSEAAVAGAACVANAAKVYISVYPNTIAVGGENATPYASVAGPNNEELRSLDVKFSIADTTIVHVTGIDSNGRPILSGRRAGTTKITGTCGSLSDSKDLTVTGGSTLPTQPPASQQTPPSGATSGVAANRPALPQSTPSVGSMPGVSREVRVPAGGDLQGALDSAQPGDAILLAPGGTYVGNFYLRAKGGGTSCGAWITLRTDGSLPPAGQRVTPSSAGGFAKLMSPNSMPTLQTDPRANCYRVTGIEITIPSSLSVFNYGLVALGDGGYVPDGDKQTSMDLVPQSLVLDRLYIHGQTNSNFARCVALNSGNTAIVDSWISECHARGFEAQAIEGWNGPGPFLIENNHLAGAGENVMFGGGNPGIPGLIPSDITIRRNHLYKDPAWKGVWTAKNSFELKNARRLLVEGNVFENSWIDAQMGMAIVIKSALGTPSGGRWQGTTDVTLRSNIITNAHRGLNIEASDGPTDNPVQRVRAENNLFVNIGAAFGATDDGWLTLLMDNLVDVALVHNTFVGNLPNKGMALVMDGGGAQRMQIDDNVFDGHMEYATFFSGVQVGTSSIRAMAGDSWSFAGNVVANVNPSFVSLHPSTSWYPSSDAGIGFASSSDFRLGSGSIYRGKATDSRDPGVDMDELLRQTNGAIVR
jgi:hypothetical protein